MNEAQGRFVPETARMIKNTRDNAKGAEMKSLKRTSPLSLWVSLELRQKLIDEALKRQTSVNDLINEILEERFL